MKKYGPNIQKGEKRNLLTAIECCGKNKRGDSQWKFQCDCGQITICRVTKFRTGETKSCGCLRQDRFKPTGKPVSYQIWLKYYSDGCNYETFLLLSQQNCEYCGKAPSTERGKFRYNGLDRIDSSLDHSEDNIVTCCWHCNRAKYTMSVNDFLSHIQRIYLHNFQR